MRTQDLKQLFEDSIRYLGVNDIEKIEQEFEVLDQELREQANCKTIDQARFYMEQIQARKDFILNIIEGA